MTSREGQPKGHRIARRRSRLIAAVGLTAALVAGCSSATSSGVSTTVTTASSVTGAEPNVTLTTRKTLLPPSTTLSIKPKPTNVVAPTTTVATTSVPATVAAPTTTASTAAPAAPSPGQPTGRYQLRTSRSSSAPADRPKGALMKASKDGYDRSFLIAMVGDRVREYGLNNGWRLTKVNDDAAWNPAGRNDMSAVTLGRRYEMYVEPLPDVSSTTIQMTVFDPQTSTFNALLPVPNDVFYFGNDPWVVDDHTVSIVVGRQVEIVKDTIVAGTFFYRTIDVSTGEYDDAPFDDSLKRADIGPSQWGPYLVSLRGDEIVTIDKGVATLYRQPFVAGSPRFIGFVDDTGQERSSGVDEFLRAPGRNLLGTAPSWRRVKMAGWSGNRGYVSAQPTSAASDPNYGPAVFDIDKDAWDFVFSSMPPDPADPTSAVRSFVLGAIDSA
jgi:hypothetical protein